MTRLPTCFLCLLLILGATLSACGGGGGSDGTTQPPATNPPPPSSAPNQPPTVNAGPDQSINAGEVVNLAGTASDSDGNIATYSWEQIGGAGVALSGANTADASFTAPAVSSSAVLEFRLEVTDDAGASASDTVKVTVSDISKDSTADVDAFIAAIDARFASETWALGSEQDTAQAQASASGTYLSGGYLSAARNRFISHLYSYFNFFFEEAMRRTENGLYFSYDFMNSEANWQRDQWRAYLDQFLGAYFGGHNSNDVDRIIKNDVLAAIDDAIINALNRLDAEGRIADAPQPENKAPTANAGSDQTVSVGTTVSLSGSGTDPDGFIASVRWQQESGTSVTITDADMEFASFVAPTIEGSEELVFRFVVTDNDGAYASDTVTITVSDEPVSTVNELPTAEAGTNRTVDEGAAVDLTGLGTDSDGTIVSYAWQQVSGTVVTIFNSDTANASFTAPEVSATEKLEFRFTVTDNDGATASDLVTITVIDVPAIAITVEEPRADAIVGAELNVTAIVNSTLEVAEVRATVSDRQSQLFYSADTGRFEGILSLEGLARGAHTLEVVAKDVVGEEAREVRGIVFDKKPELTVLAPLDNTTAIPLLRVTASCVDDDPIGCEIIVYATEASNDELFSGQNSIDSEIDLSAYAGSALTIRITAIDSAGQVTELSRRIYVEVATALSEIFAVSGLILDVQDSKILHQIAEDSGDRLEVIDWRNGTTNSVPLPAGKRVSSKHFLTPFGAIFVTQDVGGSVLSSRVYDWNQGVIDDLGFPNSANSLAAEGNFAIWNSDDNGYGVTLTRRDLASRSNLVVSSKAGNWGNDVATNGAVAYWSSVVDIEPQIELYSNGVTSILTNDVDLWNTLVLTDGTRAVYRKHTPCCNDQTYAIVLHDGSDETVLREAQPPEPSPGRDYQIVPGWVAYTDIGNLGQRHVWLLDPTGQQQQLTVFGESSTIDALGDNGEVMLLSGQKRYLATPDGELTEVGSSSGKAYWADGQWYVAIGRSLFLVGINSPTTQQISVLVGDIDCFGMGGDCSDGDPIPCCFDNRGIDDPLGTDQWDTSIPLGGPAFDFTLELAGATPLSASIATFTAGIDLVGATFLFNGTDIGFYVEADGQENRAATVVFDVPVSLLSDQNNLTLSAPDEGFVQDGFAIDYVQLTVEAVTVSP